ncbi:hypothetical protein [Sinorhizobium numidicum]|uniref:hypothetical protein n=1 Tax=Sinorhizobium numidicum TaxID=680248 RepID=UPI0031452847
MVCTNRKPKKKRREEQIERDRDDDVGKDQGPEGQTENQLFSREVALDEGDGSESSDDRR